MSDMDLNKISFFEILDLQPITSDSSNISENHISISSHQYADLFKKNNNVKTGYEDTCIKKGAVKYLPFKDFDFIGKNVVCQKCCQKFASRMSYRAHIGTSICIRTYNGPNLVYLKYKNRNSRRLRKKNKNKLIDDLHHDIKKNLLNPEMLNTLQTRNNCYSDIVHQRIKVKGKHSNNSNKNDYSSVKKPRGRPRKNIEIEPKKRGRPKKINTIEIDSSDDNDYSLNNNFKSELKLKIDSKPCSVNMYYDDSYNYNENEIATFKVLSCKMKILTRKFWKLFNTEWNYFEDDEEFKDQDRTKYYQQTQKDKEEEDGVLDEEKDIFWNIDMLENELKSLFKKFQCNHAYSYQKELELMLSKLNEKRNEYKKSLQQNTIMSNEITENEGKENIQCTIKENNDDIETKTRIDSENNNKIIDNSVKIWVNDNNELLPHENNSDIEIINEKPFENESNSNDRTVDDLEISDNITLNSINTVNNRSNYFIYKPNLKCRICNKNFISIVDWKLHESEHITIMNKQYLCKICGHKFKVYNNFAKHFNAHGITERKLTNDKMHSENFSCKCGQRYRHLKSYYDHIKTHLN